MIEGTKTVHQILMAELEEWRGIEGWDALLISIDMFVLAIDLIDRLVVWRGSGVGSLVLWGL
jgi:hypothetical protein